MLRRQSARGLRRGFTLVELLIVILLIFILMAFVVPQFFGAREKAGDRVAQQTLRSAVGTAKQIFQDNESYAGATVAKLKGDEPDVVWTDGVADKNQTNGKDGNSRSVSVEPAAKRWVATSPGENDICWFVVLNAGVSAAGDTTLGVAAGDPMPTEYGYKLGSSDCDASTVTTGSVVRGREFPIRD